MSSCSFREPQWNNEVTQRGNVSSAVLTQKLRAGPGSRQGVLTGFQVFPGCADLLLLSADISLRDVLFLPPGHDFALSFIHTAVFLLPPTSSGLKWIHLLFLSVLFPFSLCRQIKGKQGNKSVLTAQDKERKLSAAYEISLAVCVLELHLQRNWACTWAPCLQLRLFCFNGNCFSLSVITEVCVSKK